MYSIALCLQGRLVCLWVICVCEIYPWCKARSRQRKDAEGRWVLLPFPWSWAFSSSIGFYLPGYLAFGLQRLGSRILGLKTWASDWEVCHWFCWFRGFGTWIGSCSCRSWVSSLQGLWWDFSCICNETITLINSPLKYLGTYLHIHLFLPGEPWLIYH